MNIAIFNWRDLGHPKSGGAEVLTDIAARGLAERGHRVVLFTSRPPGSQDRQWRYGYDIIRAGSEITCRLHGAKWLYHNHEQLDVVVDEVNTLPFLSPFVAGDKTTLYVQQLAREVWRKEAPPVVGEIGYRAEPAMMSIYRRAPIIALSASTASSCRALGLGGHIDVVPPAVDAPVRPPRPSPVPGLVGYVGRLNPSKRIDHIIAAVDLLRRRIPSARLEIVGRGPVAEVRRLQRIVKSMCMESAVTFLGYVGAADRERAFSRFDVLAMASCREGWGLVVSEAAHHGVPSAVYPAPGLVDSTVDGKTGVIAAAEEPNALAAAIEGIVRHRALRAALGSAAKDRALQLTRASMIDGFERALLSSCARPEAAAIRRAANA